MGRQDLLDLKLLSDTLVDSVSQHDVIGFEIVSLIISSHFLVDKDGFLV